MMHFKRRLLVGIAAIAAIIAPLTAHAQNSDLSGQVKDLSQAIIPAVTLQVINDSTGVEQSTKTNGAGAYLLSLAPGAYTMNVTKDGFKSIHRTGVVLQVGQPARLDFTLAVGDVAQTVEVNSGTEVLQESTSVGSTITAAEIARLPVDGTYGRNYTSLVTLTPGTSNVSVSGSDGTISGTNSYSVNGQRNPDNNYSLDGMDNNFLHKAAPGSSPPMDAIQEFRVTTNNSSDAGRSAGASIDVITKSGTRNLHGSTYFYSRQALFDANDWFRNNNGISKGVFHYADYGVAVGGPMVLPKLYNGRDKMFWFFSYGGFRSRTGSAIISTVPTAAERGGDFSALGINIYDPLTSVTSTNGTVTRQQFVTNGRANVIPANRLDPVSLAYINALLPLPNLLGTSNNYINTTAAVNHRDVFVGRLDYHLDSKNLIFFRALDQQANQLTPQATPNFAENTSFNVWNWVVGWDATPNPRDLIQTRFGYNNPSGPDITRNTLGLTRSQFFSQTGIQLFAATSPYNALPTISATDFSITETAGTSVDNIYEFDTNYTHVSGANVIKFGFTFEPRHYYHDATSPTSGTATYTTALTSLASVKKSGSGTASFLLGYPSNIDRGEGGSDIDAIQKFYAGYGVFNRKLSSRLTAEAGLRYEFYTPIVDKQDRLGTLWVHTYPTTGGPLGTLLWAGNNPLPDAVTGVVNGPPNRAGFGRGLQRQHYLNFMPRVGVSYLLDPKTIVRAGYGIYDNSTFFQEAQDERKFYPYNNDQTFATNTGLVPDTTLRSSGPAFTDTTTIGGYAQDPEKKTPYSQQFNLTVQHEFPGEINTQIAYVGSVNRHQIGYTYFNTAPIPGPGAVQSRRLLPQYGDVEKGANAFSSNYNALQALISKRFKKGLQFQANYTYGRSLDYQSSLGETKSQNPYNPQADYSRSSFDLTHIFNLSFVYDLPFGHGRQFGSDIPRALNAVVGGWSIESINRFETGPPLNPTIGGVDQANVGASVQRPNLSGNPNAGPRRVSQWFNTGAFSLPAQYTFGNAGAYIVQQDGQRITNVAVYKRFPLFEGQALDIRAEAFNLPNTPSFGPPVVNQQKSSFGTVSAVSVAARQLQFAARYTF